ncbi:hypothetical protein C5Y96_26175 [Blastopirellula marina]|uniref:HEAT repeat domain-containing protein n=1 Tax=Blastopirellula marina TaxID=124 RepID=A0A2S8EYJ6_9BACT|nr:MULTISPECIES: HEAT repeat domain-containing protein [Pirellulaceae]PQO24995.1 hypothetical protein C5Y96_26175 [Blastopirellula marina]RCS40847.1 HEAT repeat domain-containing protein [Bremerella cremea]
MSIAVLAQVYDEVRRLSIAGSSVAPGDFRLKKLITPLEKSGEKAPVFKKVAESVSKVVESNEATSAEALLDLSTLVNAILYTQGEVGTEGELEPVEQIGAGLLPKRTPASLMKSVATALTTSGSGRLELLQESLSQDPFPDPRLLGPAIDALDGSYHEVGDLVERTILPQYGKAIVPIVLEKFDRKGGAGDARRLSLLHQVDPDGTESIIHEVLEDGSSEVKIVAISKLRDPKNVPFLIEQSKAKAAKVRDAAFSALAGIESSDAAKYLIERIREKGHLRAVREGLKSRHPDAVTVLLDETRKAWQTLLDTKEADKKAHEAAHTRLVTLLEALEKRTDKETEKLLLELFPQRAAITKAEGKNGTKTCSDHVLARMSECSNKTRELLIAEHATYEDYELAIAAEATLKQGTPAQFYEVFHIYLVNAKTAKSKKREAQSKAEAISQVICNQVQSIYHYWYNLNNSEREQEAIRNREKMDPRWLDLATKHGYMEIVYVLARPGHKECHKALESELKSRLKKKTVAYHLMDVMLAIVRSEHPDSADLIIETIRDTSKRGTAYFGYALARFIPALDKSALPKLEALLGELPENEADHYVEAVAELKNRR